MPSNVVLGELSLHTTDSEINMISNSLTHDRIRAEIYESVHAILDQICRIYSLHPNLIFEIKF